MKRSTRRPAVTLAGATLAAGLSLGLAGCGFYIPQTVTEPYEAGDGTNAILGGAANGEGGLKLRNFLLVTAAQGEPGVLVGAIANDTGSAVPVTLTLTPAAGGETASPQGTENVLARTTVTARPGVLTQVGPAGGGVTATGGGWLQVPSTPVAPGGIVTLRVETPQAGGTQLELRVLQSSLYYSSVTPTAGAGTRSPGGTSASPTESAAPDAAATQTGTPGSTEDQESASPTSS